MALRCITRIADMFAPSRYALHKACARSAIGQVVHFTKINLLVQSAGNHSHFSVHVARSSIYAQSDVSSLVVVPQKGLQQVSLPDTMQEDSNQLPHAAAPHDALRYGLPTFKQDALPAHPVETMTKNVSSGSPSLHDMGF